jgi:hypothetical protein
MKRALFVLFAVLILTGLSGCAQQPLASNGGDPGVQSCGCGRTACCWPPCNACGLGICRDGGQAGPALPSQQPPVAAITYPYYTTRGPRDFLQQTPSPIGP